MAYTYISDIASGGFGRVVLVQNEQGQQFALKMLQPSSTMGHVPLEDLKKRFAREVKYQQAIDHPNVVAIVDANLDADPPYCVMELAQGTLWDELQADHTLGGNPAPALFDMLSGLEALAQRGHIHRDLKPQNVLRFVATDGTVRYAISDFGLMHPGTETTTLTVTGAQGGTQFYAAPELMQDFSRATVAADIYAFGAILHDIFAAQPRIPYSPLTVAGPMGAILEKCTKTNPARRYSSIAQLREDLFAVLNTGTVAFTSSREERAVELLNEHRPLTSDEWDEVFLALDDNERRRVANANIFTALRVEHIGYLNEDSPQLVKSLGVRFCEYVMARSFNFDYCDILSSRLETLFEVGDTELKALVLLAFLELGTSHNRWLVERNFFNRARFDAEANVIQRFLVEVDVRGYPLKWKLRHLISSISVDPNALHPNIRAALA